MAPRKNDHSCEWRAEAVTLGSQLDAARGDMIKMKAELDELRRHVFGRKSEKMPPIDREVRRGEKADPAATRKTRKANAEAREKVITEEVPVPVPPEQRCCPHCEDGGKIRSLGSAKKQCSVWEYVEGFFRRRRYHRETIVCSCGAHVFTAACPDKGTSSDKTRYAPSFVAHLITAKCADSIPIYRIEAQYRRLGIPIARSTMNEMLHRNARLLLVLSDRLLALIAADPYVHADETPMRMSISKKKAYVWTFVAGNLVGYRFSADRSGATPTQVLGDSKGSLVVDAYTGYNDVTSPGGRVRAGCLAHCRRKLFDACKTAPEAGEAMAIITAVYKVEREAKLAGLLGTREHLAMRRKRSRPLMKQLRAWLDEQRPRHVPKGPMGKAIGYAIDNWTELTRFLDDAKIAPDNNKAEAALRKVALGRKNYLHVRDEDSGKNLAGLYSLVATCEKNGVNPIAYLTDVLVRVQTHPGDKIDELLPHKWKPPSG